MGGRPNEEAGLTPIVVPVNGTPGAIPGAVPHSVGDLLVGLPGRSNAIGAEAGFRLEQLPTFQQTSPCPHSL